MAKEPIVIEWTSTTKGDDPKRFRIEDVKAGKYEKWYWLKRIKRSIVGE